MATGDSGTAGAAQDDVNEFVFRQGLDDDSNGTVGVDYRLKAQGLLDDPNDFAQAMLLGIVLLTVLWGSNWVTNFFGVILPGGILLYGIYLTHSRGALVAMAITLAVALRKKLKLWGSIAFAFLLAAGMLAARFTGGRQISVGSGADRLELWSEGLYLLKHSRLLGIGYHNFADQVGLTAHNSLLLVATETGVLGLIVFISGFVICFYQIFRLTRALTEMGGQERLLRELRSYELALTAYLSSSWFLSRAYNPIPYLLIALVACVVAQQAELHPDWELTPSWPVWLRTSVLASVGALALIYAMVRLRTV